MNESNVTFYAKPKTRPRNRPVISCKVHMRLNYILLSARAVQDFGFELPCYVLLGDNKQGQILIKKSEQGDHNSFMLSKTGQTGRIQCKLFLDYYKSKHKLNTEGGSYADKGESFQFNFVRDIHAGYFIIECNKPFDEERAIQ